MRLIDADALYEQTAEWEARALSVIEEKNRKPFDEMDANEIVEWRKWSCILNERSAFKHDVFDAPSIDAVPVVRCKDCEYWDTSWKPTRAKEGEYWCSTHDTYMLADDYCSMAGRKKEE